MCFKIKYLGLHTSEINLVMSSANGIKYSSFICFLDDKNYETYNRIERKQSFCNSFDVLNKLHIASVRQKVSNSKYQIAIIR